MRHRIALGALVALAPLRSSPARSRTRGSAHPSRSRRTAGVHARRADREGGRDDDDGRADPARGLLDRLVRPGAGLEAHSPADGLGENANDHEGDVERRPVPTGEDATSHSSPRGREGPTRSAVRQTYSDGTVVNWSGPSRPTRRRRRRRRCRRSAAAARRRSRSSRSRSLRSRSWSPASACFAAADGRSHDRPAPRARRRPRGGRRGSRHRRAPPRSDAGPSMRREAIMRCGGT